MVPGFLLLAFIWLGVILFVVGSFVRALKYFRAPVHLRWELYPVAHEPRRAHGGSRLEELEYWKKPIERSLIGEVSAMGSEIFLLRGVWEHNRPLWFASAPFHWGLYLLALVTVGLLAMGFFPALAGVLMPVVQVAALVGGALLTFGALYLLVMRCTVKKLLPYTDPIDRVNLAWLVVVGALTFAVPLTGLMQEAADGVSQVVRFQPPQVSALVFAQMAASSLFILYLPFTRMIHYLAKYFTYHEVRWDDGPRTKKMNKRLAAALGFGVSWSADHVGAGRSWAEVATSIPGEKKEKGS